MILTLSNLIEAHPSSKDASKTVPPKVTGSDGNSYALTKAVYDTVAANLGHPLDVDVKTEVKGAFTNRSITAVRIPATGPESPTSTPPVQERTVPLPQSQPSSSWQSNDAVRQRLIVKQSSLRAAIELFGPLAAYRNAMTDAELNALFPAFANNIMETADLFVAWVFKEEVYGLTNNHEGGSQAAHGNTATAPTTPAAKALETARNKAADIRNTYLLEDAVCPNCGFKEALHQGQSGWYCAAKEGGCGHPRKGERLDTPISFGEWKQRTQTASVPWK